MTTGQASTTKPPTREKSLQVADEVRDLIVTGKLADGHSLGREQDLIERFGVSRPTIREALRILEAEGLVAVLRGVRGGVVVRHPDSRTTAKAAALLLQMRDASLSDVVATRSVIEPGAVRILAESRRRRRHARALTGLLAKQTALLDDPEAFNLAAAAFSSTLVSLTEIQTLIVVSETLDEVVSRAVAALPLAVQDAAVAARRTTIQSQERLIGLIRDGLADEADRHWRSHMERIQKFLVQHTANTPIELSHHH